MADKEDLRVIKTKMAIKKAFFELLNEQPCDRISIRDIADRAMINRGTFYLHYKDKEDLIDKIENEIAEATLKFTDMVTVESFKSCLEAGKPFPHILALLRFFRDHQDIRRFMATSETNVRILYEKVGYTFYKMITACLNEYLEETNQPEESDDLLEYRFIAARALTTSVIFRWLQKDCETDIEAFASFITLMVWDILYSSYRKNSNID